MIIGASAWIFICFCNSKRPSRRFKSQKKQPIPPQRAVPTANPMHEQSDKHQTAVRSKSKDAKKISHATKTYKVMDEEPTPDFETTQSPFNKTYNTSTGGQALQNDFEEAEKFIRAMAAYEVIDESLLPDEPPQSRSQSRSQSPSKSTRKKRKR